MNVNTLDDLSPHDAPAISTDDLSNLTNNAHLKQKRARSQLSCTPCRTGKLKCNREKPVCDQCSKRSRENACVYLPPPPKHRAAQNVKGRIRQLETLVVDLMNQNRKAPTKAQDTEGGASETTESRDGYQPSDQPTPPSDNDSNPQVVGRPQQKRSNPPSGVEAATPLFGQMDISKDEIRYHGEAHWNAILNSISELKRDLGDDEDEEGEKAAEPQTTFTWGTIPTSNPQPHATTGLGFMLGESMTVTKEQLIAAVPEKKVADCLLSLWFNSPDPMKAIVHAPTFQDEYKRFMHDPEKTPVMWLGLLFAILSLAASFGLRDCDPLSLQAQKVMASVNRYHTLAASAAVLADFTKPKEFTLECLMLYTAGLRSNDAFVNVWLMIGLVVRLALRMGYHRDPEHYPNISIFHGEMRRRIWAIINTMDVLISFQLGLPSMVKLIQCDVQPPRNILDRDFCVTSKGLPPNRPVEELTPSSYIRVKMRLVRCFADAAELSHATVAPSYEETMNLDQKLEEAKAAIPPLLQMPGISELVTDPAEQVMCRFNLDLLYLKTKTLLHRRYMSIPLSQLSAQEQERGIGRSRETCIVAALRVLRHHHTIYHACQPGGQLESVKWYMGSLSTHDFLLAAMIICLELSSQINDLGFQAAPFGMQCPRRRAMMDALEKSQRIWSDTNQREKALLRPTGEERFAKRGQIVTETEKASRAMAVMLEKMREQFPAQARTPSPERELKLTNALSTAPSVQDIPDNTFDFRGRCDDTGIQSSSNQSTEATDPDDWTAANGSTHHSVEDSLAQDSSTMVDASLGCPDQSSFENIASSGMFQMPQYAQQMDFSMISDMLGDVNNSDFDWQMLDNQFTQEAVVQPTSFSNPSTGRPPATHPGFGNASSTSPSFIRGAGSVAFPSQDSALPDGNAAFDQLYMSSIGQHPAFAMEYTAEEVDLALQDVDFDLGVLDANNNGMYPATTEDWAVFYRRKKGMPE